MKTDDLFFKDAYFTKERAIQAWMNDDRHTGLTKEFLENAKRVKTDDERLLILAGENKIYQLRFQKEFFLWMLPSVDWIDNEKLKDINEFDSEFYFSYNCVATVITKSPKIDKVKIGKNDAELLPLGPYFKEAKDLKFWFYNTAPDAFDCQGPSGETFTFYDNSGRVIKKIEDN
ncbi:hypothetical protein [Neobacillus sp. NPDC093127]|uniref:hypothetical protein n=1 Tax=Neobacillus sp. NPDC093127 TaxID=3364296 RepID=UPI0037F11A5B